MNNQAIARSGTFIMLVQERFLKIESFKYPHLGTTALSRCHSTNKHYWWFQKTFPLRIPRFSLKHTCFYVVRALLSQTPKFNSFFKKRLDMPACFAHIPLSSSIHAYLRLFAYCQYFLKLILSIFLSR